jgi:hypothetical protein
MDQAPVDLLPIINGLADKVDIQKAITARNVGGQPK